MVIKQCSCWRGTLHKINLLDLALEILALNEVGDLVVVLTLLGLLHILVALGELAEGSERVWAQLVQDAGDKLSELLVLSITVDSEGIGGDSGVDYTQGRGVSRRSCAPFSGPGFKYMYAPLGAEK